MIQKRNDGGPAFASKEYRGHDVFAHHPGMSLRDWFAGQALMPMLSHGQASVGSSPHDTMRTMAVASYAMADAMIAERDK